MDDKSRLPLILFSTVFGIFALLLFTTLVQDVFFKGTTFCASSVKTLGLKTAALFAAGGVVGFKTFLMVLRSSFLPQLVLSILLVFQLFIVGDCPVHQNPFWFVLLQQLSIIGGLWLGVIGAIKFPLAPV